MYPEEQKENTQQITTLQPAQFDNANCANLQAAEVESKAVSEAELKKAIKQRDKKLKEAFTFENRLNPKFIIEWMKTSIFQKWVQNHDT